MDISCDFGLNDRLVVVVLLQSPSNGRNIKGRNNRQIQPRFCAFAISDFFKRNDEFQNDFRMHFDNGRNDFDGCIKSITQ